ncbi:regulatory protein RecX [Plantactinospora sp. WMMB334]|uniref:regulatory protein RecX n=1 Tax=Plantactinospora sp. WMMB334 TaxID=3404119 RepID=UPI003B966C29
MAGRRGARTGRGWDAAPSARTGGSGRSRRGGPAGSAGQSGGSTGQPGEWPGEPVPAAAEGAGGAAAGTATPHDEAERAREICLRQLAVRPRTRAELATALARRGISPEVVEQVLDRYDEVGIVDDAAFARAWVSSRHQGRGLARRALANELRQRGVEVGIATEALGELDDTTEAETARLLVDRKLRSATGSPEVVFRRLVAMLARKGYPAGVAIRAVKEALAERDAEAAEFADQIDADALAEAGTDPDRDAL